MAMVIKRYCQSNCWNWWAVFIPSHTYLQAQSLGHCRPLGRPGQSSRHVGQADEEGVCVCVCVFQVKKKIKQTFTRDKVLVYLKYILNLIHKENSSNSVEKFSNHVFSISLIIKDVQMESPGRVLPQFQCTEL